MNLHKMGSPVHEMGKIDDEMGDAVRTRANQHHQSIIKKDQNAYRYL